MKLRTSTNLRRVPRRTRKGLSVGAFRVVEARGSYALRSYGKPKMIGSVLAGRQDDGY